MGRRCKKGRLGPVIGTFCWDDWASGLRRVWWLCRSCLAGIGVGLLQIGVWCRRLRGEARNSCLDGCGRLWLALMILKNPSDRLG